jgi:alpha-galactosidase
MRRALHSLSIVAIVAFVLSPMPAGAVAPTDVEKDMIETWVNDNFLSNRTPPFSFTLDGASSKTLLSSWSRQISDPANNANATGRTITWTNVDAGLEVRCVLVKYHDYPVAEWTVYLKNIGNKNTGNLRDILALDISLSRTSRFEYSLYGIYGDFTSAESYRPFMLTLGPGATNQFAPPAISGKSSDGTDGWPYHNLRFPGGGIVMAIGWPGQWSSSFTRVGLNRLDVKAGQQLTNLYLRPGEEIRTPSITLLFWRGDDVVRSQNLWRRWYVQHVLPNMQGPVQQIQVNGNDAARVNFFVTNGIVPDICWRDAGAGGTTWYPSDVGPYANELEWLNTGTWDIVASKFPNGFKPFSDYVHSQEMKFLLWFEPERVGSPQTFLGSHPEWLLPGTSTTVGDILNLGNPGALNWLVNHIDGLIKSEGIDWYREDMNGNGPLPAWRNYDALNRQGITENFYVQGHLAFWDMLMGRNPDLRIDSCASGGRRNDLETMRRAVPLLRSDFQFADMSGVVEGNQCHTYGLSNWLPFQGTGCYLYDTYSFRSFLLPSFGMGELNNDNLAAQQQAYSEADLVGTYMIFGDYYPLTPYSLDNDVWMAWQFDRPETKSGVVQAFRRSNSLVSSITLQLQGLNPETTYVVTNLDLAGTLSFTGESLMKTGLTVTLPARGSAILLYEDAAGSGQQKQIQSSVPEEDPRRKRRVKPLRKRYPNAPRRRRAIPLDDMKLQEH